jgi:tRNA A37 N6-isopentenylltransferase MiaA
MKQLKFNFDDKKDAFPFQIPAIEKMRQHIKSLMGSRNDEETRKHVVEEISKMYDMGLDACDENGNKIGFVLNPRVEIKPEEQDDPTMLKINIVFDFYELK